jgi:hypothetical protein
VLNSGVSAAEAVTSFHGDDGGILSLPFTFPQASQQNGPTLGGTFERTLRPNTLVVMETQQPDSPNGQAGSALLQSGGALNGFAIFQYPAGGWHAVVPLETRNAPSYLLAFDYTNGLQTGLALANVSAQAGNVKVVVRDDAGAVIPTRVNSISVAGGGHAQLMLDDATLGFPEIVGKRGTVEFDTPAGGQISVLGLRANGKAVTTLPILAQVGTSGGALAQVATGGGWETGFTLVNAGATAAPFTLSFYDEKTGAPLPLSLVFPQAGATRTTASVTQTLAPGATVLIQTQGGSTNVACSAQLATTGQVSGFAIFNYVPWGQEAVVPLETRTPAAFVLVYDNTNGLATGLALANSSAQTASVPVVVRDDTGVMLAQRQIQLAGNGHTQFMLDDPVLGFPITAGKRGTIEFQTPSGGRISAVGIRATVTGAITTIPVLAKTSSDAPSTLTGIVFDYPSGLPYTTTPTSTSGPALQLSTSPQQLLLSGGALPPNTAEQDFAPSGYIITVGSSPYDTTSFDINRWLSAHAPYSELGTVRTLTISGMAAYEVVFAEELDAGTPVVVIPNNGTVYTISYDSTFTPNSPDDVLGLAVFSTFLTSIRLTQ